MEGNKSDRKVESYYNYYEEDGKDIGEVSKKIGLKSISLSNCTECGSALQSNDNYCIECGRFLGKCEKRSTLKYDYTSGNKKIISNVSVLNGLKSRINSFSLNDVKGLDFKSLASSVGLAVLFMFSLILITEILLTGEVHFAIDGQPIMIYGVLLLNSPTILISGKAAVLDIGSISIAARSIIGPLLGVLGAYIATRVCLSKKVDDDEIVIHSIAYAIIFTLVMSILALLVGHGVESDDSGMVVITKIGVISTFINSFIISILGGYLGISHYSEEHFMKYSVKKSFISILGGIIVSSIAAYALIFSLLKRYVAFAGGDYSDVSDVMTYCSRAFSDSFLGLMIFIAIVVLMGVWLFTLANFASVSILGITTYSIFTVYNETSFLALLCPLIPIVILVLIGRNLKTMYGEDNIKAIGVFSGVYTIMIAGFAYFTRFVFSLNLGQFKSILDGYIQEVLYDMGMSSYYDQIYKYVDKIYTSVGSGLYIGPNIGKIIIATFIFSCIVVYIGSRSKKLEA